MVVGTNLQSSGTYDLKNPNFRYMSTPQAPPGSLHTNPTETYFDSQPLGGEQLQDQRGALQQVAIQQHPQVMRSSTTGQGYPFSQHSMGVLQTGTEVIPVVNGSIISPSVLQHSQSGLQLAQPDPSSLHMRYSHSRQPSQGHHVAQSQPWGTTLGLQSMQTAQHSASHQRGMETGGLVDLGTGTVQHGIGTSQYGIGVAQHAHTNQHLSGGVMYQKWLSQQQGPVLQAVASHS